MSNLDLFKKVCVEGKKDTHIQIFNYSYGDNKVDIVYKNQNLTSAVLYKDNMTSHVVLSEAERQELESYLEGFKCY